jgi:asparagine synthetase B (glutamine-hydrolysing)
VAVADDGNDAAALLAELRAAEAAAGEEGEGEGEGAWVVRLLSRIRGPWALVFWHAPSQRLWWGRDAIGRRRCV